MGQSSLDAPASSRKKVRIVRVVPIMNPHPDYDMLARAFLEQARLIREGKERPLDPDEPASR